MAILFQCSGRSNAAVSPIHKGVAEMTVTTIATSKEQSTVLQLHVAIYHVHIPMN